MTVILYDNQQVSNDINEKDLIQNLKDKNIFELTNSGILIFPNNIKDSIDLSEESYLFQTKNSNIWTCNLVGIVGKESDSVRIHSRFTNSKFKEDYFLRYMIEKVFNYNVTSNKTGLSKKYGYYDLLIFLFPYYLNQAIKKGVYKEYVTNSYNDSKIKGPINISRHIRNNTPFIGNIAYDTREFSNDNLLIRLIRHTIEKIESKTPELLKHNEEIRDNVSKIKNSIKNFTPFEVNEVIQKNISKPISHPYFEEYSILQKICIKILLEDKSHFEDENESINGILIDVSWLWEQYIWKVTGWKHYGFDAGLDTLHIFKNNKRGRRYPDFAIGDIPIDTKYKKHLNTRDDFNQMITYMHAMQNYETVNNAGYFLQPTQIGNDKKDRREEHGQLIGYGGTLFSYSFFIPQDAEDYKEFINKMKVEEKNLINNFILYENISVK